MDKENIDIFFPPRPEEPMESDCCGNGCNPCVFDIYKKQLLEWEKQCNFIISNGGVCLEPDAKSDETVLSQVKFTTFQILSIEQHVHNSFLYLFQAVKPKSDLDFSVTNKIEYVHVKRPLDIKVGQHLIMKGKSIENENSAITRAYTPISGTELGNIGCFKILVKLYDDGEMSKFIKSFKVDDIVEWRGPYGNFEYIPNSHRFLLMFCAGTGIAPMYPIVKSIIENDSDETFVHMIFACRDFEDILLRTELLELAHYWNFSPEIYLSQANLQDVQSQTRYGENIQKGRIDKDVVLREFEGKMLEQVAALICGTKSFAKDMVNYLKQSGLPDENIHLF